MQAVDVLTKKRILKLLDVAGAFKPQTFDAIVTERAAEPLTAQNVELHLPGLRLVEMKTTKKAIPDSSLSGFFFGATESEFQVARALKERYLFAFVVINNNNVYGRPFFVLLTYEQMQARIRTSRIQYQINLRTRMPVDLDLFPAEGTGPQPLP